MTNRAMIDLETLSTEDNAAVVSIGVVIFDDKAILDSAHMPLTMNGLTGHIDPMTVRWWMEQSKDAQLATFSGDRFMPHMAAEKLWDMCHGVDTVWANDPHFDIVILKNWWRRHREDAKFAAPIGVVLPTVIGKPWPFNYNQPRSYRTILEYARREGFTNELYDAVKGEGTKHNAMDDAAAQARVVIACEQWLSRSSVRLVERMFPDPGDKVVQSINGDVIAAGWRDGTKT